MKNSTRPTDYAIDFKTDHADDTEIVNYIEKEKELEKNCKLEITVLLKSYQPANIKDKLFLEFITNAFQRIYLAEYKDELEIYKQNLSSIIKQTKRLDAETQIALDKNLNEIYLLRLISLSSIDQSAWNEIKKLTLNSAKTLFDILPFKPVVGLGISFVQLMREVHQHAPSHLNWWQKLKSYISNTLYELKTQFNEIKAKTKKLYRENKLLFIGISLLTLLVIGVLIAAHFFIAPILILTCLSIGYKLAKWAQGIATDKLNEIKREKRVKQRIDEHEKELSTYIKASKKQVVDPQIRLTRFGKLFEFCRKKPYTAIFVGALTLIGGVFGFEIATLGLITHAATHLASVVGGTTSFILAKTAFSSCGAMLSGSAAKITAKKISMDKSKITPEFFSNVIKSSEMIEMTEISSQVSAYKRL